MRYNQLNLVSFTQFPYLVTLKIRIIKFFRPLYLSSSRMQSLSLPIDNLYGYNTKAENDKLVDSLDRRITFWLSNSILLIGDFNVTLNDAMDRWPPAQHSRSNLRMEI